MNPRRARAHHGDYPPGCVVAYLRVSTTEQAESGAGLDAQRAAIETYAARHGLAAARWHVDEGVSGAMAPERRPALAAALAVLEGCERGVLVVAKVDRIARKAGDLHRLIDLAERQGWTLSAADNSIDLATPHGRAMAGLMGVFAELERDMIRARTRDALAARKAAGVRLGRPIGLSVPIRARIAAERQSGRSLTAIADGLTDDDVPTAQGGARWYASTVRAVLASIEHDEQAAAAGAAARA